MKTEDWGGVDTSQGMPKIARKLGEKHQKLGERHRRDFSFLAL